MRLAYLLPLALVACGSQSPPPLVGEDILAAPPPGQGVQVEMVASIDAGQDVERCRFVQVGEELWVGREQVRYTPGSHHVLLFTTPYREIPTVDHAGRARDTSGVIDCSDGAFADWDIDGVIGGSQSAKAAGSDVDGIDGVALHVPAGAVLLMNTHYLNATGQPLETTARINLWTVPAAQVVHEAGVLFFYNFYIRVPPLGAASARMRCPITSDITLLDAQSHMHRRGMGFAADLADSDGANPQPLYRSQSWSDVPVETWPGGLALAAGRWIDYRCDYKNEEQRTVLQGLTTRDEMCMFVGLYYPRNPRLERCALDDSFWTSDLAAMHVGSGDQTCAQTTRCTTAAHSDDRGDSFSACIAAMCTADAPSYYALDRCRMTRADGTCAVACQAPGKSCDDCLASACAAEAAACEQGTCG